MKSVKITARTENGKIAIERALHEGIKQDRRSRFLFKMLGYTQEIISREPFIVMVSLTKKVYQQIIKAQDIANKIQEALTENDAKKDTDYLIEVTE